MERVVLAFSALGKSFLKENAKSFGIQVVDNDVMYFDRRSNDFINTYVDEIEHYLADAENDYVFCNINNDVMYELCKRNIPFTIVAPIWRQNPNEIKTVKELIFGRLVLRKTQTAKNVSWLENMKATFDNRTKYETFEPYINTGLATIEEITVDKPYLSYFI